MKSIAAILPLLVVLTTPGCERSQPQSGQSATAPADSEQREPRAAAQSMRRIFAANYGGDTVSVAEGNPEMEQRVLEGFDSPQDLKLRPAAPVYLAVANSTGVGVTLIDPASLATKATIDTGGPTDHLAFSPDGKLLFALDISAGKIHVIDMESLAIVGDAIKFQPTEARHLEVAPDGSRIYVLTVDGDKAHIAIVDLPSRTVRAERIEVGVFPKAFALGNKGRTVATASFDHSTISVIDTETLKVTATHDAETGMGIAVHPTKPIAYSMASFDDEFHVVDLETGKTLKTIAAGAFPTYPSFGPEGRFLYIPHEESDSIVKFDTETNTVVNKISVGKGPVAVAVYEP